MENLFFTDVDVNLGPMEWVFRGQTVGGLPQFLGWASSPPTYRFFKATDPVADSLADWQVETTTLAPNFQFATGSLQYVQGRPAIGHIGNGGSLGRYSSGEPNAADIPFSGNSTGSCGRTLMGAGCRRAPPTRSPGSQARPRGGWRLRSSPVANRCCEMESALASAAGGEDQGADAQRHQGAEGHRRLHGSLAAILAFKAELSARP